MDSQRRSDTQMPITCSELFSKYSYSPAMLMGNLARSTDSISTGIRREKGRRGEGEKEQLHLQPLAGLLSIKHSSRNLGWPPPVHLLCRTYLGPVLRWPDVDS
jgi:hypothetical protein